MYSLFIPKYQSEPVPFLITKTIKNYMKATNYKNDFIISPGFMSNKTHNIDDFVTNLYNDISCKEIHIGLFNGMNGTFSLKTISQNIREYHQDVLSKNYNVIPLLPNTKRDHRKIIFFFKNKNWDYCNTINICNYDNFINSIEMDAILIGSSNVSNTTYYAGNSKTADKGEADVFIFLDNMYYKQLRENEQSELEGMILSESVYPPPSSEVAYLKRIFEDFLKNSLL